MAKAAATENRGETGPKGKVWSRDFRHVGHSASWSTRVLCSSCFVTSGKREASLNRNSKRESSTDGSQPWAAVTPGLGGDSTSKG